MSDLLDLFSYFSFLALEQKVKLKSNIISINNKRVQLQIYLDDEINRKNISEFRTFDKSIFPKNLYIGQPITILVESKPGTMKVKIIDERAEKLKKILNE